MPSAAVAAVVCAMAAGLLSVELSQAPPPVGPQARRAGLMLLREYLVLSLGLPRGLLLLLGACRLATAYSFIKGKKEIAAEQLVSAVYLATLYVHHMTADKLAIPALLLGATLCMVEMDNASSRYYLTKEAVAFDLDSLAQRLGSGRAGNIAKEGGAE